MNDEQLKARLTPPPGSVRMVLDTDTYNEIDDQFALVYALLSPERLSVEAVYAAPFHNVRSAGPGDGMEKSYEEILRLLERLGRTPDGFAFRGSTDYFRDPDRPERSDAAMDLVERAMASPDDDPLYVVAIGAPTNVANALLIEPAIAKKIVVVWLGGQPFHFPSAAHFNLRQDVRSSQRLFDRGVPLVHVPCDGVASHLLMTLPTMEERLRDIKGIGEYLLGIFAEYMNGNRTSAKEIWDVACIAWLVNPDWVPTALVPSPILTDDLTWRHERGRHLIRNALFVRRNPVMEDLFTRVING